MAYWELQNQMLQKIRSETTGAAIVIQSQMSSIEAARSALGPCNDIIREVDLAWQRRVCYTIVDLMTRLQNVYRRATNFRT